MNILRNSKQTCWETHEKKSEEPVAVIPETLRYFIKILQRFVGNLSSHLIGFGTSGRIPEAIPPEIFGGTPDGAF